MALPIVRKPKTTKPFVVITRNPATNPTYLSPYHPNLAPSAQLKNTFARLGTRTDGSPLLLQVE